MKLNGHPATFDLAPPLPKWPFGACPFCDRMPLAVTRDHTSIVCRGCGSIMPAEWMEAA